MDRIEDMKSDQSRLNASFSSARKGGERVLEVDQIEVGYSKERPLTKVSFQLMRGIAWRLSDPTELVNQPC